ncbi:MAG: DUF502 domain-containing protein [Bdellovibrionota bacterium]
MTSFKRIFLRGLFTLLPIAVTIYVLYTGILIFETLLGSILKIFIPQSAYVPGLGFLLSILVIFLFGLILNSFIVASFLGSIEKRVLSVPLIRTVYSPLRDLMNLFSKSGPHTTMSTVLVDLAPGMQALGLVTRDWFDDLGPIKEFQDKVTVYIPMSYGLGGFTLLLDKNKLNRINLPAEKALSLAITGWVKASADDHHVNRKKEDALHT